MAKGKMSRNGALDVVHYGQGGEYMAKRADKQLNGEIERAFFQKAVGGWIQREEKTITEDDGKGSA